MAATSAKKFNMWRLAGVTIFVVTLLSTGWAATQITKCETFIREPGDYILANDLVCPGQGIYIVASNVTLNLDGHQISGTGSPYLAIMLGYSGFGRVSNVTVVGPGTISNFGSGVVLFNAENSVVRGVTSTRNFSGFDVQNVPGEPPSRSNTLENNTANNNVYDGFTIGDAERNTFRGNVARRNKNGFDLGPRSHENLIENSTAEDNFETGIEADGGTGNTIRHNTAHNNGYYDLADGPKGGHCDNTWEDNTFHTANNPCIH